MNLDRFGNTIEIYGVEIYSFTVYTVASRNIASLARYILVLVIHTYGIINK